jgi:uncharacterized damage-inducible protein DinB
LRLYTEKNMSPTELLILNFEEIRRRSIKLWSGIPEKFYNWQPDHEAMTIIEMVRHELESIHIYHLIVNGRGNLGADFISPWENRPYTNIVDELAFAEPYTKSFFETIRSFSDADLDEIEIVRAERGQRRKLGDYLLRIAYHEGVHTGQMLSYLRTLGIERPEIWD